MLQLSRPLPHLLWDQRALPKVSASEENMKLRAVDKPGQSGTQKSPRRRKKFFSEFFSFKSPAKVHEPDELPPGRCRSVGVVTSRVDAGLPTTYSVFASSSAYLGGKWSIYASLSRQLTVYMLVATGSVCWILLDAVAFIVEKLTKPLGVNYMGCIDVLEAAIESSVPEGSTTLQDLLWKKVEKAMPPITLERATNIRSCIEHYSYCSNTRRLRLAVHLVVLGAPALTGWWLLKTYSPLLRIGDLALTAGGHLVSCLGNGVKLALLPLVLAWRMVWWFRRLVVLLLAVVRYSSLPKHLGKSRNTFWLLYPNFCLFLSRAYTRLVALAQKGVLWLEPASVPARECVNRFRDVLWNKGRAGVAHSRHFLVSTGGEMEKGMRYRFGVGDRVMLRQTTENWQPGTVVLLEYREPHWLSSKTVPYQIRTDEGKLLYTPVDTDESVRPGNSVKAMSRKELEDFAAAAGHPVSGRPSKMRLMFRAAHLTPIQPTLTLRMREPAEKLSLRM
ncbi:hypothetical protein CYMTET_44473 [Cymbomonas tetramitiformis]|uniref:Transmembrane protein n=1 Tax=Cymbomonas tetramitiformis TaxID=36881 RepID=A0AAE0EZJ0_9CHLO|nr:hypothetical protein CYMTET_44473 [Cymbomonas tetramitiformis]